MFKWYKTETELETRLDKWLYFIKNLEDFQSIPEIFKSEVVFLEAMEKAELSKLNQEEMAQYNYSLKIYRDNINTFNYALEEGIKKVSAEKVEEGIKVGEAKKQKEFILNCRNEGLSIAMIAKLTGLGQEEVTKVINE